MSTDTAIDTSSISFTALYTGHVWAEHGLSNPAFQTEAGRLFYHALTPLERAGRIALGANFRTLLLQRHRIIDRLLERAVDRRSVTQVLEIASGLSPRGWRFETTRPNLHYVEADLPEMAERKERLLDGIDGPVPDVVSIDIFRDGGGLSLERVLDGFDRSEPVAVITEGLVNYFELETIDEFWHRLGEQLAEFPAATYLTDTYFAGGRGPLRYAIEVARRGLGVVVRSPVSFHFHSVEQTGIYFDDLGFDETVVHDPRDYYATLPIPQTRSDPLVRVIEARMREES